MYLVHVAIRIIRYIEIAIAELKILYNPAKPRSKQLASITLWLIFYLAPKRKTLILTRPQPTLWRYKADF